jgi:hypothetical protein
MVALLSRKSASSVLKPLDLWPKVKPSAGNSAAHGKQMNDHCASAGHASRLLQQPRDHKSRR